MYIIGELLQVNLAGDWRARPNTDAGYRNLIDRLIDTTLDNGLARIAHRALLEAGVV
jgi:hypothetical protein